MEFNTKSFASGTPQALTTSFKTVLAGFTSTATLRRGKVMQMRMGPLSNPVATDTNLVYAVFRQTVDGTGETAVTPVYTGPPLEAGSAPSPGSTWGANYTGEGTLTDNIWSFPMNQHCSFHWYAPTDLGMPWPAKDGYGLAFRARGWTADGVGTVSYDVDFEE